MCLLFRKFASLHVQFDDWVTKGNSDSPWLRSSESKIFQSHQAEGRAIASAFYKLFNNHVPEHALDFQSLYKNLCYIQYTLGNHIATNYLDTAPANHTHAFREPFWGTTVDGWIPEGLDDESDLFYEYRVRPLRLRSDRFLQSWGEFGKPGGPVLENIKGATFRTALQKGKSLYHSWRDVLDEHVDAVNMFTLPQDNRRFLLETCCTLYKLGEVVARMEYVVL